jgi:hypothetical protein
MDWDTVISILKWIGLVFAAGLVGYFGKYLGQKIIARFSKNKPGENIDKNKQTSAPPGKEKQDHKLEKKRLKLEQKQLKKQKK